MTGKDRYGSMLFVVGIEILVPLSRAESERDNWERLRLSKSLPLSKATLPDARWPVGLVAQMQDCLALLRAHMAVV